MLMGECLGTSEKNMTWADAAAPEDCGMAHETRGSEDYERANLSI
jgi:hypothetical protein